MMLQNKFSYLVPLLLLSLLPLTDASSQNRDLVNSGSFYSGFGFGAPSDINSPGAAGMGLTGVSAYYSFSPSTANPAHWGMTGVSQGTVLIGLTNYKATDDFSSAQNALLSIENFQLVLPLKRNNFGVSFAFTPVSRSDFQRVVSGEFMPIPDLDLPEIEYQSTIVGSGGVNRIEFGAGYRIASFLSVGYAISANLLSQEQEISPIFSDLQYRSVNVNRSIQGYSAGHRFGLHAHKNNLFRSNDQLSFGAAVSLPVSINAERTVSAFHVIQNTRRIKAELNENALDREGTIQLPLEFNTGLTYNLNRFINISAELLMQNWNSAQYSFDLEQEAYYKDRIKTGFGVQYHPYRSEQLRGLFSNFKYSLGTTYDTGHLSIQGEDITTLLFNAGIGFMSNRSVSSIDLSFQYGMRGTQSSNLVKESIWGFKLSLNLAEFMFIRSRFD